MKHAVSWSLLALGLALAAPAAGQQVDVTCRCDGRSFEASCAAGQAPKCNCAKQAFTCEGPVKQSQDKAAAKKPAATPAAKKK